MDGYFKCEKCNIVINVITTSRNAKKYTVKVKIPRCPHCNGVVLEIDYNNFLNAESKVFLRLKRIYNFKHVGDRVIEMGVKFL